MTPHFGLPEFGFLLRGLQWTVLTPLLRRASALVAVSRFERGHFSAATGIDPSRFSVIPNGGALPPFPPDLTLRT